MRLDSASARRLGRFLASVARVLDTCYIAAFILTLCLQQLPLYHRIARDRNVTCEFRVPDERLPLITIISPCRNGEPHVVEALESVSRQHYPELEHILYDACSTDNTLALVKQYPDVVAICEPDDSAHHAMNKGLAIARGDVIGFLNVDDLYPDGILIEVGRLFAERPDVDLVIGHAVWFEDSEPASRQIVRERIHDEGDALWLPGVALRSPAFNGCFFRRTVFDRIGNFETKYNFTADTHLLLRCALARLKVAWIDKPTIWYRRHSGSRTFNPERRSLIPMSWELFEMAQEFAGQEFADHAEAADTHRFFLTWHAFAGSKLILRSLSAGQIAQAARATAQLTLSNPLWPARLVPALSLRNEAQKLYRRPANDLGKGLGEPSCPVV
jgi:GT2 family glycosyltransferase